MITMTKKPLLIVEGNIGAGKSTFLRIIGSALNAQLVYEPHTKWQNISGENLLERFYQETQRWGYTFQTYAFVTRVIEQQECAAINDRPLQILERSVYSDRHCFAKNCYELGYMDSLEWKLYQEWFAWLVERYTPRPDAFIYLQADPETCYQRLLKRNRSEEAGVSLDYLHSIHNKHEDWLIHKKDIAPQISSVSVLTLPCNEDFENNLEVQQAHIKAITKFLNKEFDMPEHMVIASSQSRQLHV